MSYPYGEAPPPYSAVPNITTQLGNMFINSTQNLLVNGAIVHLWSKKSGYTLRIGDRADVSAKGRNGDYAKFIVHANQYGVVSLQNKKSPHYWLAINNGIRGNGSGGPYCQFTVVDHGHGFISLESVQTPGHYIGVNDAGDCKARVNGGISNDEKFYVIPVQPSGGQAVPPGSRLLTDGAKVRLWSVSYGMNVRIQQNGAVDGKGWSAFYAQYTVHNRGEGIVALQNVQNPNNWIAIKNGQTVGTGRGGPFTNLRVHDSANGTVCLESVQHPGQHLGILADGSLKQPTATGRGDHGRFHIILDVPGTGSSLMPSYVPHPTAPQSTPQWGYPSGPQAAMPLTVKEPHSNSHSSTAAFTQSLLVNGAIVHLWSKKSGYNLRIGDRADVSAKGRNGDYAKFIVHANPYGVVCLQNKKSPHYWLAINNGIRGNGSGGPYCQFTVVDHGHGFISLESVQTPGHYIGVNDAGDCKPHLNGGISNDEKFYVIPVQPGGGQAVPPGSRLLTDGAKVRLWSVSYGMNVRIQQNGAVDGKGWSAFYAQYTVHNRGEGIVALQNVQNPNNWIAIKNGQTVGTGRGGPFTNLRIHDSANGSVCFESVQHPGQHLGILADGSLKQPTATGRGDHGQFHIILDVPGTAPIPSHVPHPSVPQSTPQWGYPIASQGGCPPAPQGAIPPPATYPQCSTYTPSAPPVHIPPPNPSTSLGNFEIPVGFNVMDAFQHGNVVQLVVRSNGYPLRICNNELMGFGSFTSDCDFKVNVVPSHTVSQIVIVKLQSVAIPSNYLAIRGGNVLGKGRGGRFCDLKISVMPDNYVVLESLSQPGNYVNMTAQGAPNRSNTVLATSQDAQFFVRLSKQFYTPRALITTPRGIPSLITKLRNDMIIQLEAFHTGVYLSVIPNSFLTVSYNPMDPNTLLKVIDRGMGILSLAVMSQPSFLIKETNHSFMAMESNDLSVDLRFYESSDGSVKLESVTSPTCHLVVNACNRLSITSVVTVPGTYAVQTRTPLN